jgi:hypothetical protein
VVGRDNDLRSRPLHEVSFPAEIIGRAVWLYFRFPLGLRMVEELLADRQAALRHSAGRSRHHGAGRRVGKLEVRCFTVLMSYPATYMPLVIG